MIFWAVALGLIAVVLVIAWRNDRKHHYTITRRNGAVESDIAGGAEFGADGSHGEIPPGSGL